MSFLQLFSRSISKSPSPVSPILYESLEPRLLLTATIIPGFDQLEPFGSMVYKFEASGDMTVEEDNDGFEFFGLEGEYISIGFTPDPALDVRLRLFDIDNAASYFGEISTPGLSTYVNYFRLPVDANYAVVIGKYGGAGDYDVTLTKNAFVVPDEFDDAANDSIANAFDLDAGFQDIIGEANGAQKTAVYSDADAVEDDYYSFTLAAGDKITLRADSTSGSNVQIELSKDGGTVGTGNLGTTSVISEYEAQEAGTFVVKVSPQTNPGYSLTVLKNADVAATDNSDIATPWEIDIGDVVIGGVVAGDMQYYRFHNSIDQPISLTSYLPIASGLDPYIELYSDAGVSIELDSNTQDGINAYVYEVLPAGWYKVGVGSDAGDGEYALHLDMGELRVTNVSPSDTQWVADEPASVVIDFNHDLDAATVTSDDLTITIGGSGVVATGVTVDGSQATFTLPDGLDQGVYSLELAADAIDDIHGAKLAAFSSSFVYADPIEVASVSPFDTEWIATEPGEIVLTFSHNLDPATVVREDLLINGGAIVADSVTVTGDTATFTIPALDKGDYTLEIAVGTVADDRGVEVAAFSSSFVYADPITVTSISPSDTQWITTAPSSVVVTFSHDPDAATVEPGDLIINGGDVVAENVSVNGNQATFTLPDSLEKGTYSLEIAAGTVTDDRGVDVAAFSSIFEYNDPITIVSSSVQPNQAIPSGTLRFKFEFDGPLYSGMLDSSDVTLTGVDGEIAFDSDNDYFNYDEADKILYLAYNGLDQSDDYTLQLKNEHGAFWGLDGGVLGDNNTLEFITRDVVQASPAVISFGSGAPAIYQDLVGNQVRVVLSGPGAGEVYFEVDFDGNLFPSLIKVVGSSSSSYLTITTASGVYTKVQEIEIGGAIGEIIAKTTSLESFTQDDDVAELTVDGRLRKLVLDDLLGVTNITINASNSAISSKYTAKITLDEVENGDLLLNQLPISSLTVTEWKLGTITSTWIKTAKITGDRSRGIDGDFGALIRLTSYYNSKSQYALQKLDIAGNSTGVIIATAGGIKYIEASQWDVGLIRTKWVKKINIKGSARKQLAGDFGAALDITSFYRRGKNYYSLWSLKVAGEMFNAAGQSTLRGDVRQIKVNSTGESLDIDIGGLVTLFYAYSGMAGTIEAGAFRTIKTYGELSADITATSPFPKNAVSIRSLKAGWASDATVDAARGIRTISVGEWDGGSITAGYINKLSIHGRGNDTDGKFNADLELTGVGASKYTLKRASIAGAIIGDDGIDNSGEDDAEDRNWIWDITGDTYSIYIRGDVSNWKLTSDGYVKNLRVGDVSSTEAEATPDGNADNDDDLYTDIAVAGDIYKFSLGQFDTGRISANAIHSMYTRNQRGVDAQLANAIIVLTGSYGRSATALGKLKVYGNIVNTTIDAPTGAIKYVRAWNWVGGELSAASVGRLLTTKATGGGNGFSADLDVVGVVRDVDIAGDLYQSDWSARSFSYITVKGNMIDSAITASQMPHSSIKGIGYLVVKEGVSGSRIKTNGHIKSIKAGAMQHSTVFAGPVTERDVWPIVPDYDEDENLIENDLGNDGDSVWDLPNPLADDLYLADSSLRANIYNFTITGKTLDIYSPYFGNSNIAAAGDIGTVSIFDFNQSVGYAPYGFAADRIGTFKITSTKQTFKNLDDGARELVFFTDPSRMTIYDFRLLWT